MNYAALTDQDIDRLSRNSFEPAFTFMALHRMKRRAEIRRAHAAIEEETTDAGKAEPQSRVVTLKLSVNAAPAVGKTSLLLFLLDRIADAGLMSVGDTKAITLDPMGYLASARIDNTSDVESLVLDLDLGMISPTGNAPDTPRQSDASYLDGDFQISRTELNAARFPTDYVLSSLRAPIEAAFELGFGKAIEELVFKVRVT